MCEGVILIALDLQLSSLDGVFGKLQLFYTIAIKWKPLSSDRGDHNDRIGTITIADRGDRNDDMEIKPLSSNRSDGKLLGSMLCVPR